MFVNCEAAGPLLCYLQGNPQAEASLMGAPEAPEVRGCVRFYQTPLGVLVAASVRGLPHEEAPCAGRFFAFHIHAGDACTGSPTFADAGGHYNPGNCQHPHHAGDLPPLLEDRGFAWSIVLTNRFTVEEILQKTVIIHAGVDDFTSQPAGNAGARIACGVIRLNRCGCPCGSLKRVGDSLPEEAVTVMPSLLSQEAPMSCPCKESTSSAPKAAAETVTGNSTCEGMPQECPAPCEESAPPMPKSAASAGENIVCEIMPEECPDLCGESISPQLEPAAAGREESFCEVTPEECPAPCEESAPPMPKSVTSVVENIVCERIPEECPASCGESISPQPEPAAAAGEESFCEVTPEECPTPCEEALPSAQRGEEPMMAEHPYCEVTPKDPPVSEQIGTLLRAVEAVAAEDAKREMKASSQGSAEPISDCYFPRCKAGRMQGSLPAMIEQGSGPASVSPPATVPSDEELACGEERYLRGRIPPSGE